MARTEAEVDPRLIALTLPGIPGSMRTIRLHIRDALSSHGLDDYAEDVTIITSELVTNAIQHARGDATDKIKIILAYIRKASTLIIAVTDSFSIGPRKYDPPQHEEHGRGLQIVEALSTYWGWHPLDDGKAVFAVLALET